MSKEIPAGATSVTSKSPSPGAGPVFAVIALSVFVIAVIAWKWFGGRDYGSANIAAATSPPALPIASATATSPAGPSFSGRHYPPQGHAHLNPSEADDFVYNSNPPTSGPHKELFTDQFTNPTPLPNYIQVHLLEHGNVLLQYNCTCPDIAASLSAIAFEYDQKLIAPNELQPTSGEVQAGEEQGKAVIVAPYPGMKSKIALTAWTRLAALGTVDKPKIESFINLYLANVGNASQ